MRLAVLILIIMINSPLSAQTVSVTAHRGASGHAPENTLAAIKKALEFCADRIEVDVQQSSDGVVICMHDKKLDRTTNGKGSVRKKTWSELKALNANVGFQDNFPNEKIPTLKEVFELIDGSTEFVIEIKEGNNYYPGIEERVAQMIIDHEAIGWAIVHSFNDKVLEFLRTKYPGIRLQKLFVSFSGGLMLDFKLHAAKLSDYDYVEGFGISKGGTNSKLVNKIHEFGKVVHVWTVNNETDITEMIEMGVDGIISNYPDKVNALLNNQ